MTTSVLPAPASTELDTRPVIVVHGGSSAERSVILDRIGAKALGQGGTVRCIDPRARMIRPAGNVSTVTTLSGVISTLFDALDIAASCAASTHLLLIDRLELLLRCGGSAANETDVTLALLVSACERSGVRLAISTGESFAKYAPMTSFALRDATRIHI